MIEGLTLDAPPAQGWLRVPVGREAARWSTRGRCRRVLLVVHNVTSATRLLDVLPLLTGDFRVQVLVTSTGSSPFAAGMTELFGALGLPVLPWEQAKAEPFDLAVSASYGGELALLEAPLVVLSHGAGYNKRLATPDTGHRTPDTGQQVGGAPVFGMSEEWLLHEGRPIADATVLSHPEQLDRLRAACPSAVRTAVLAGDPCFDRLLDAERQRAAHRRGFGLSERQRLVLLSSTWGPRSLVGDDGDDLFPQLVSGLLRELPIDEYRVAAALHPNVWHGHGSGQVHGWLRRARRSGLLVLPPLDGWRQALVAADCVIGDHGSVTYYGAALGRPVLLAAAPLADLDPHSPVGRFCATAPTLDPARPLRPQLDAAIAHRGPVPYASAVAELTSAPGRSAALLRALFYRYLRLPEPPEPALLDPLPRGPHGIQDTVVPGPVQVSTELAADEVAVTRLPASAAFPDGDRGHLVVDVCEPDLRKLDLADVLLHREPEPDPAGVVLAETLAAHTTCGLAALLHPDDRVTALPRDGEPIELSAVPGGDGRRDLTDPAAYAAALYAWLADGRPLPPELTVRTGRAVHRVRIVSPAPPGER